MPTPIAHVVAVVSQIAAGQWGLLTTAQAEREGVTRLQLARLADAGVLVRIVRGVYATASSPHEHRALRAAWLALDPPRTAEERLADLTSTGVVSHTSAAALHRLGDLLDDQPEITLPHRKQSRHGTRLHRGSLADRDVTLVDGMPTTTEERTVADLLRDGHDPEHVAAIIGQGVRRGVIDLSDLAERVEPLARRHGQPDGHALVEHLLDLVGLSEAALTRDLLNSRAGQELVAAGRASALSDLVASLAPQTDTARQRGLETILADTFAGIDMSGFVERSGVLDAFKPLREAAVSLVTAHRATLEDLHTPALPAATETAGSPAAKVAGQGIASKEGRGPTRAATVAHADEPEDDQ